MATLLCEITAQQFFLCKILTFSRPTSTLTSDLAKMKRAKTFHGLLPYVRLLTFVQRCHLLSITKWAAWLSRTVYPRITKLYTTSTPSYSLEPWSQYLWKFDKSFCPNCRFRRLWIEFLWRSVLSAPPICGLLVTPWPNSTGSTVVQSLRNLTALIFIINVILFAFFMFRSAVFNFVSCFYALHKTNRHIKLTGARAFRVVGPTIFNSLSSDIHNISTFTAFSARLNTHYSSAVYQCPKCLSLCITFNF